MGLPKIDLPTYDLTLPTSGETIKIRPFNVREEKLLLIALESKDQNEITNTVKQIVNNCIVSGKFDVNKSPFFEVDFIFIFLRAKSIGEKVAVKLTCNNVIENKKCGNVFPAELDISNCELVTDNTVPDFINLGSGKGVKMKYPGYGAMKRIDGGMDIDRAVNVVVSSIDYITDGDEIHSAKDYSKEDLNDFVMSLSEENFRKLEEYTENFPTFAVRVEATCNKCGFEHKVRYNNFADFFL